MVFLLLGVIKILSLVIIADAVLSWVQSTNQSPRRELMRVTNPIYAPFRAILPPARLGGLDISPLIVLFLLQFIAQFIARI
jgi:YggT family protein